MPVCMVSVRLKEQEQRNISKEQFLHNSRHMFNNRRQRHNIEKDR